MSQNNILPWKLDTPVRIKHHRGKAHRELCAQVPWDAVLKGVKDYDPRAMAMWQDGQPAPYLHVARALAAMDSTTKRLRISDVIANMFRSLLLLSPGALALQIPPHRESLRTRSTGCSWCAAECQNQKICQQESEGAP